ncbi:hypothetical protein ACWZJV_05455 [Nocardioides sp. WG-D5]
MTRRTRKNRRQGDFRIVARGIRRVNPDISRIVSTAVDHYLEGKNLPDANRDQEDRQVEEDRHDSA